MNETPFIDMKFQVTESLFLHPLTYKLDQNKKNGKQLTTSLSL